MMKAVQINSETKELVIGTTSKPNAGEHELLVRIKATALNRADLMQRKGLYPPPQGVTDILGLEIAGVIEEVGSGVKGWKRGERIMALLPGGGYAEYAVIPAGMAMHLPDSMSFEQGAAIPEAFLTAYMNLFWLGKLKAGKNVLIHAGASGVGTAAIQLVRAAGSEAFVTAGSKEKLSFCRELGAKAGWNYREGDFSEWVLQQTNGEGVSMILDFIGEPYFSSNLRSLKTDGTLVIIGLMGGSNVQEFNLMELLSRRLHITGTTLRSQPLETKVRLTRECEKFLAPRLKSGVVRPVIDSVIPWTNTEEAHQRMKENRNIGKIVMTIDSP